MIKNTTPETAEASLAVLHAKGVRYGTVIDLGSADGYFFIHGHNLGLFADAAPANIDANDIYEDSLRAIQEVLGGHYFIGAVTDHEGQVEMTAAAHPYWDSLRPDTDPYWDQVNKLSIEKRVVPAVTLDTLADRLRFKPPFLLKLDVQGAEVEALRGAGRVLRDTVAVVCEADLRDFHGINAVLEAAGFGLFDVTNINRMPDRSLGWFYPVYLNRSHDHLRSSGFWDETQNDNVILAQIKRRENTQAATAAYLAKQRARRGLPEK